MGRNFWEVSFLKYSVRKLGAQKKAGGGMLKFASVSCAKYCKISFCRSQREMNGTEEKVKGFPLLKNLS